MSSSARPLISFQETKRISPAYDGREFGTAGPYEWVFGTLNCEIDPDSPRNRDIALLDLAPRNAGGFVEYETEIEILKPVDESRGNGWLLYDVLNRGTKRAIQRINTGPATNMPFANEHLGTAYLLERGFTVVWSSWQGDVPAGAGRMLAKLPVAARPDGPYTGASREEFIKDARAAIREDTIEEVSDSLFRYRLAYPAADIADASASLTVRQNEADPRQTPADLTWRYLDETTIEIEHPANFVFDRGAIYEFIYTARNPVVMGLGFSAVRDTLSFLRYGGADGTPHPLKASYRKALGFGLSQSGRFLRDFLHRGFNADLAGRPVFDAVMPLIAGSRKIFLNEPFSQPGRFSRQHEDHTFPGDQFPFGYADQFDPVSGRTDGILNRPVADGVCPKIMHVDTDSEYMSARSSLVTTDAEGNDVALPDNVRLYLASSVAHGDYALPPEIASAKGNTLTYGTLTRALIDALVEWIENGTLPPSSVYPTRAAGTLVDPEIAAQAFPKIGNAEFPAHINALRLTDHTSMPPATGQQYRVGISAIDSDGNSIGGVPHPLLIAPAGTHTGWQIRKAGYAQGELFNVFGSYWPFAATRADRLRDNDSRPSLEERYGSEQAWRDALAEGLAGLADEGFLLEEDKARILERAEAGYFTTFNFI
ncbi:alpha/beta hydrolase domain-containing protein [Rhizobiaceae bacterium BDR2-2]|uniref:Alpha/beta hydrolase domain-containing protein n=1 Tax=Ectorhizobium quercum TaxID=2965071 RepID=A0AAE3SUE2_9HYPH|nr:alpha/beta hydrolase domain-containing protein [Ectorhizobium quercum]MCX8997130.1 alpha/beta hydrolase domain-containing protein [Ectorhizobium quercum]